MNSHGLGNLTARAARLVAAILLFLIGGSTWAEGADAGESAEIVFDSGKRVISIDATGGDRRNLTPGKAPEPDYYLEGPSTMPAISKDGRYLARLEQFYVKGWPHAKIIVSERDGTHPTTVRNSRTFRLKGTIDDIGWMPSGRLLAVEYLQGGLKLGYNLTRIATMEADGSKPKVILKRIYRGVRDSFILEASPSPDGREVLFTSATGGAIPSLELLDLESGKVKVLRHRAESGSFSPDGRRIVFVSDKTGIGERCFRSRCFGDYKVFVARSDGSAARRLTKGMARGNETDPSWSPDGTRIAFASDRNNPALGEGNGSEIYTVRPDGTCLTWLTNGTPAASSPSWGPEPDADPSPVICGRKDREPLIELVPDERSVVNGEPTDWPQLWLGPVFQGKGQSMPPGDGRELAYEDCVRFDPTECRGPSLTVSSDDVCLRWVDQLASFGELGRVVWKRGAIAFLPSGRKRAGDAVVLTGGQAIMISTDGGRALPTARYLKAIDVLRPVGGDQAADLEPPVIDRKWPARAAKYAKAVERAGSVARAAGRLRVSRPTVRVWSALDRILDAHGPFGTVSCKGWL